MPVLSRFAYGKINFSLDVLGLRSDGYHEIATVMQSISLADRLDLQKAAPGQIKLKTDCSGLPVDQDNLVMKAAVLLQEKYRPPWGAEIFLHKRIPLAAGLAGGSADAAAALRSLNELWELELGEEELRQLGRLLGADVPFCLLGGLALARGVGEKLTPLPNPPDLWLVLVKPEGSLSAGRVYRQWDLRGQPSGRHTERVLHALRQADGRALAACLGNDLEAAACRLLPEIEEIKKELLRRGAWGALMSGSGPTVFGLTGSRREAEALAAYFQGRYPAVFVARTMTGD